MKYMGNMSIIISVFVLISCLQIAILPIGAADPMTLIVDINGSGDYTSIQAAIDSAVDYDIISVTSGTYNENIRIDKSLIISGESKDTTKIIGDCTTDIIVISANKVEISGFTIYPGNIYDPDDPSLSDQPSSQEEDTAGKLSDGPNPPPPPSYAGIVIQSDGNIISDNTIRNCNKPGIVIVDQSVDSTIFHNNFINNNPTNAIDNGKNIWSLDLPEGGNYWSDYGGSDQDGDGIGDVAYPISEGDNIDNFPFIVVDGWVEPENQPPNVAFYYEPSNPEKGKIVYFNSTSDDSDGSIISWLWAFSDGHVSIEDESEKTTHIFRENGTYTVSLIVVDDDGAESAIEKMIEVGGNKPPVAAFRLSLDLDEFKLTTLDEIVFVDESYDSDGNIASWIWKFGDGDTESNEIPSPHIYDSAGVYTVNLEVTDNNGDNNIASMDITIKDAKEINVDGDVDFERAVDYNLDESDGFEKYLDRSGGSNAVFSIDGDEDYKIDHFISFDLSNQIDKYWDPDNEVITDIVYFDADGISGDEPVYDMDGDGTYDRYLKEGMTYPLNSLDQDPPSQVMNLEVVDNHDLTLTLTWDEAIDNVMIGKYQIYRDGKPMVQVHESVLTYIDDGLISDFPLEYHATFFYNVSAVDISGNEGKKSEGVIIMPVPDITDPNDDPKDDPKDDPNGKYENRPPNADASAGEPYTGLIGEVIEFNGSLSADSDGTIVSYIWDFGDGIIDSGMIVTHAYQIADTYSVTLTVKDNASAVDIDTVSVIISQPNHPPSNPAINGPINGSKNIIYSFRAVSIDSDNDSIQYIFDWGDDTSNTTDFIANGTLVIVNHSWSKPGRYTISVKAFDNKSYSGVTTFSILIDAHSIDDVIKGCLIDEDSNRVYDLFHNDETSIETDVEKYGFKEYLIDPDGNGWKYVYNPETHVLSNYMDSSSSTVGIEDFSDMLIIGLIAGITICLLVIALVLFRKDKRHKEL